MQSFGPWYDAAYVVPGYDYTTWSAGAVRSGPMNLESGAKYLVEKCEGNFGILLYCPVRQYIRVDSAIIRPDSSGICCAGKTACPTQTCDELNFTDKLAASVNGKQMLSSLSTWKVADEMTSIPGWTCQDMISNRMEIQYSCWDSPDFDMTSTSASSTTTMMPTQSSTNNPTASTTPRPSSTTPTVSSSTSTSGSTTTLPNTTLPTGSTSTDYTNTGSTPNFSSSSTYPTTTPFNTTMSTSKPYTNTGSTPNFSSTTTSGSTTKTTQPNNTLPTGSTSTQYTNTSSTPNFSSSTSATSTTQPNITLPTFTSSSPPTTTTTRKVLPSSTTIRHTSVTTPTTQTTKTTTSGMMTTTTTVKTSTMQSTTMKTTTTTKPTTCGLDKTLKPGATGEEVARAAVIKLLKKLGGNPSGDFGFKESGFLLRAAFALTKFGEKNTQYVHQIWELDEYQFNQTLNSPLAAFLTNDIDWFNYETLVYDQLNVPYFSLVAFVTFTVEIVKIQITNDLTVQGEIFKQITHNKLTEWVDKIADLEIIQAEDCGSQMNDIVFLVDESGSVGADNFNLMKSFLEQFASVVNPEKTRIAVRPFSTETYLYFGLKEKKNKIDLIRALPYQTGWTNTSLALLGAMNDFEDDRNSVKIVITITDGISQNPIATKAAADKLKADPRNIQSFAIGVAGAQMFELENIASTKEHVEMLENFQAFEKILSTVLDKVCTTGINIHQSAKIEIAGKTEKTESKLLVLKMNGKKSFEISSEKKAMAYVSFENSNPSSAMYDFSFEIEAGMTKQFTTDEYFENIYIALYNVEVEATILSIFINDKNFELIPEITKCPFGSKCVDSQCFCDEGYIVSRRPEGCMFDPTLTPCDRYGSRCGENSVCSVQKYAPYYECSCAEGYIGAAPKCVKQCDDGEREIKEFLAFVEYLCKNQFFIDYEPVENNIVTNLKVAQNSQIDVNVSLDSMLKHMIASEMPDDGKSKLEYMLGKNIEDFILHFFENGNLDDLFGDL